MVCWRVRRRGQGRRASAQTGPTGQLSQFRPRERRVRNNLYGLGLDAHNHKKISS